MNQNDVLVIVDAGHGGVDSGAVGNNLQEKNLNLQAAKYMYQRLQELGIPVKMTRVDDEYLPKDKRIQRVRELSNNNPNTLLISNHINAGGGEGAEIVYALRNSPTLAQMAIDNIGAAGQKKEKFIKEDYLKILVKIIIILYVILVHFNLYLLSMVLLIMQMIQIS